MCIRDRVMLTKNLYQQVRLVNGIRGEVVELVYADFRQGRHTLGAQGGPYGAYVRLSHYGQETCDLMVEPMSFHRIGNLGKSSTMKARLQEEVRLVEIAQGTKVRYTDIGVFSAVAGNQ